MASIRPRCSLSLSKGGLLDQRGIHPGATQQAGEHSELGERGRENYSAQARGGVCVFSRVMAVDDDPEQREERAIAERLSSTAIV